MLPILRPLPTDDLSEEDFYALGRASLLSRIFSAWSLRRASCSAGAMVDPQAPGACAGPGDPENEFNGQ